MAVTPAGRGRGRRAARWGGAGVGGAGRAVAGLGLVADQAGQVREEGELLAHQRAVDAVLAGDLGQQAAQLGGALHGGLGGARGDERAQPLERDRGGRDAERRAGALQQRRALLLERAAADHLGLDVGEAGEHRVGVALADGRALGEDELEEVAGGVDLRVQVDEQLGLEDRAHDDCISL